MPTTTFLQLLESAGLLSYQAQLSENGFDDAEALCDMTEDDLIELGIPAAHRGILDGLFTRLRSARATASQAASLNIDITVEAVDAMMPSPGSSHSELMDWNPDIKASQQVRTGLYAIGEAGSYFTHVALAPLGSEMLVPVSEWTSITIEDSVVQRLLALYFCWEYPIFASLSKDHFVKDFCEGRPRYCSPMLVNALLSLGYCCSSQQIGSLPAQNIHPSGDEFFEESVRLFHLEKDHHNLTTVQALGVLSLRESSCGRDSESYYYAAQCIKLALEMGIHQSDKAMGCAETAVASATFWGAYGLDNAWALIAHTLPHCSSSMASMVPPKPAISLATEDTLWAHYTDDDNTPHHPTEQTSHVGTIFNCSCELSELIHETLYLILSPTHPPMGREVLDMYTKYLSWYETLPEFFRLGHNSTPAVLFTHMYYHFAILLLLRPFITLSITGSSISPRDICYEAANTISALLQSYGQLYTLRRTPSFIPHFILTSSILHLFIAHGLSTQLNQLQSQRILSTQVTDAIHQTIADLAAIAPCHRSAQRAHYLIGVLAKKEKIIVNAQMSLDVESGGFTAGEDRFSAASKVLEKELLAKWQSGAGRFVGMSQGVAVGVQDLQNPPFWLIYKHAQAILPSRAVLEATGFAML